MAGTDTSGQLITAERRAFVLNLRKSGATYRQIADAAVREFGLEKLPGAWCERYAHKDVARELERLRTEMKPDTEDVRQMQLERYNRLLLGVWQQAISGNLQATDRAMKLVQAICQLLGVNAPTGLDLTTSGQPVTFHVVREEPKETEPDA